jgi:FG-GAP repeat
MQIRQRSTWTTSGRCLKSQRIHIARFLIIMAMALIGVYASLQATRTAGADSAHKAAPPPTASLPVRSTLHGPAAIKHLEQTGLYRSLSAAVTAAHYRIEERKAGGYEASNPEQRYHTVFTRAGVEVSGAGPNGNDWRLGMKLIGYGYGQRKQAVTFASVKAKDDRIEYERRTPDNGSISEWYVNRLNGLEQGFTIFQAPGRRKAGEKLNLWLDLSGDLKARLAENGQAILLNGRAAGPELRYDKLHAFDATGRELEARMKLSGDRVRLEVVDELATYPVTIDPTLAQEAKLTASDAAAGDLFGSNVAINGETAVVGARGDDTAAGTNAGSAYVFVRSGTSWSEQAKLTAGDAAAADDFGISVAIDGDTIVVGADLDDDAGSFSGSAYVFVRSGTSWSQQAKLTAGDAAAGDQFGFSVGISDETVVVGAVSDDTAAGTDAGSAYVFVRSGTSWSQQAKLTAGDAAAFDLFGFAVGINGETVGVGAPGDNSAAGSTYVFVRSGTSWSQQAKLTASDAAAGDNFGRNAVRISGDTLVVGAPFDATGAGADAGSAYVFVRSGTSWSQQAKLTASDAAAGDLFGLSVGISGDTVVAGARADDDGGTDSGSAYVFTRSGTSWSQQQKLTASDAAAGDSFGLAVSISGNTVVAGASNDDDGGTSSGSAYVFAPPNQAPDCSGATPSVSSIWPPDHDMVNVTIQGVTDPDGDPVTINIDEIKQDEPTDGTGDGHTCPDGDGIGTSTAQVRAERSATLLGGENGRVYTIYFTASDGRGGSCQGSVTVSVPRTGNGTATNGGALYDSTQCSGALLLETRDDQRAVHGPAAAEAEPVVWENYCLLSALLHEVLNDPLCLP